MKFPQFFLVHTSFGTFLMLRKVQANSFRNLFNAFPLKAGYIGNLSMDAVIERLSRYPDLHRDRLFLALPAGKGVKFLQKLYEHHLPIRRQKWQHPKHCHFEGPRRSRGTEKSFTNVYEKFLFGSRIESPGRL